MDNGKSNLIKMTCGTLAVALLFAAVGIFVTVYLPEEDALSAGKQSVQTVASDGAAELEAQNELLELAEGLPMDVVKGDELGFIASAAETDVGNSQDFVSYEPVNDTELVFYRNQDTRSYVEWFYTQVTGNREVALAILDAASQFNVSPSLAFALAYTESKYKVDANHTNVNGSIDRGLFQLNSYSFPNLSEEQFYDAATSAYYGMSHLNYCLETANDLVTGLAMYNAGRNKVNGDRTPMSTLSYISKILEYRNKLDSNFSTEILAFYSEGNGGSVGRYLAKY